MFRWVTSESTVTNSSRWVSEKTFGGEMKSKLSCASSLRWLKRERERERVTRASVSYLWMEKETESYPHLFSLSDMDTDTNTEKSQEPNKNSYVCELGCVWFGWKSLLKMFFLKMRLIDWSEKFYFPKIEIRWPKKKVFDHGNYFPFLFSFQSIFGKREI